MTKDDAERVAAEVKRQIADQTGYGSAVWDGCVVAIGLDDNAVLDPLDTDRWYVRIDLLAAEHDGQPTGDAGEGGMEPTMSTYEDRMEAHERLAWCADNPEIVDAMRAELFGPAPIASGGDAAELRKLAADIIACIDVYDDLVVNYPGVTDGAYEDAWAVLMASRNALADRLEKE